MIFLSAQENEGSRLQSNQLFVLIWKPTDDISCRWTRKLASWKFIREGNKLIGLACIYVVTSREESSLTKYDLHLAGIFFYWLWRIYDGIHLCKSIGKSAHLKKISYSAEGGRKSRFTIYNGHWCFYGTIVISYFSSGVGVSHLSRSIQPPCSFGTHVSFPLYICFICLLQATDVRLSNGR